MSDKIKIDVEAGTAAFVQDMDKAGRAVEGLGHRAEGARGFLEKFKEGFEFAEGFEAFRGGLEAIEKPLDLLKESFEDVGRIGREALKLGVGAEDMSRLEHAANATHTEIGALTTGMNHLNEEVGKVAGGAAGPAADALKKLNLDARDLVELDPAETFRRVSAAVAGLANRYDRAAAVQALLGKGGRELLPIMGDLEGLMKESDAIGFTRTPEQIEKVEQEERKLAAITDEVKGLLMDIATSDFAARLVDGFRSAWDWAHQLVDAVKVLGGGNPAAERHVAELNRMAREADDQRIRTAAAIVAAGHADDVDRKVALYRQYIAELQKEHDLVSRNVRAGVAADGAADLRDLDARAARSLEQYRRLEQQAAAQHRLNALAEHERAVREDVARETAKLNAAIAEAGGDKFGAAASKLAAEGATPRQIAEYGKLVERLREVERLKHEMGDFDSLWRKSQTPLEKYNEQLKELNDLLAHGRISQEQFARAAQQAKLDTVPDAKAEHVDTDKRAELVSRRFSFDLGGRGGAGDKADLPRQALELQKKQDQRESDRQTWLQQIWQAITQGGPSGNANADTIASIA